MLSRLFRCHDPVMVKVHTMLGMPARRYHDSTALRAIGKVVTFTRPPWVSHSPTRTPTPTPPP